MPLRVSGKNINIGEALREHVAQRLDAAVGKYFDGRAKGHVTLEPEGSGYRTDCTLHLNSGITLQAEGRAQEPYASFDQAAERIEARLRRYKRKLKDRSAVQTAASQADAGEAMRYTVLGAPDENQEAPSEAEFNPAVIAEIHDAFAFAFGVGRRSRTRSDRRAGSGLSACFERARECDISSPRWPYRLDRPGQRGETRAQLNPPRFFV